MSMDSPARVLCTCAHRCHLPGKLVAYSTQKRHALEAVRIALASPASYLQSTSMPVQLVPDPTALDVVIVPQTQQTQLAGPDTVNEDVNSVNTDPSIWEGLLSQRDSDQDIEMGAEYTEVFNLLFDTLFVILKKLFSGSG